MEYKNYTIIVHGITWPLDVFKYKIWDENEDELIYSCRISFFNLTDAENHAKKFIDRELE